MPARFEVSVRALRSDADLEWARAEINAVLHAKDGTPEADRREVLSLLVEAYESTHPPIAPPDPVDAILFRLEQMNLSRKDLEGVIGPSGRVSEILNRKRPLSVEMMRKVHALLGISFETLMREPSSSTRR